MEEFEANSDSDQKISKYNSALDALKRIGEIWRSVRVDVISGNYSAWNRELDRVWAELAGDLKYDGPEQQKIDRFNEDILKLYPLAVPNSNGFNPITDDDNKRYSKQYLLIFKKEIYLRSLQNKLGKGTAYIDEDEEGID